MASHPVLVAAVWLVGATLPTVAFAETPDLPPAVSHAEPAREPAPTLARVIALAREQAPAVALARADVGVARSTYVGARLGLVGNPYVEVVASRGGNGTTHDVNLAAQLWLPLDIADQRGVRMAEADALVDWQEAGLTNSRAAAVGEAVRAFGTMVVAAARVHTFEAIAQASRVEAEIYEARLKAGDATVQDAKFARVELARNAVMVAESRADLTHALGDLARLTGTRFVAPGTSIEAAEPPPMAAAPLSERTAAQSPVVKAHERAAVYFARSRDRQAREAIPQASLIVMAGRGDYGEGRLGGGLAWTFPMLRRNQGERARADAERLRAVALRDVHARVIASTLEGLVAERREVRRALAELRDSAEPVAEEAIEAAVAMQSGGKGDLLKVLTARRDLALLKARRLDLLQREWSILSDLAALTGEVP